MILLVRVLDRIVNHICILMVIIFVNISLPGDIHTADVRTADESTADVRTADVQPSIVQPTDAKSNRSYL